MTNLNLPKHWTKRLHYTCNFQIKKSSLLTVGRFQIFQDNISDSILYIHDTLTFETWVCHCYFNEIEPSHEIPKVQLYLENYLTLGHQLNLFDS